MLIQVLSLWKNDLERRLEERARHLLEKRAGSHRISWLWNVGDSIDGTELALLGLAGDANVQVIRCDTDIGGGEDTATRRRRLSASATRMFAAIDPAADYVLLHESDLVSGAGVVTELLYQLLAVTDLEGGGRHALAGWPTIDLNDGGPQFYDVWAYRDLRGRKFTPSAPYAAGYNRARPFEVGSFGSVWLAPAELVRDRVIDEQCVVDLCKQWRREGVRLWCDPRIGIVQPVDLWSPQI